MKTEVLLKSVLVLLLVLFGVVITSWVTSEQRSALAQGGGGGQANANWILVASELRQGEGLIYLLNTDKEVLVVYAYHRGKRSAANNNNSFDDDLQFLAGRHVKWDVLYAQLLPYPTVAKSGIDTPKDIKDDYDKARDKIDKAGEAKDKN